jgi:hypothetical protein
MGQHALNCSGLMIGELFLIVITIPISIDAMIVESFDKESMQQ